VNLKRTFHFITLVLILQIINVSAYSQNTETTVIKLEDGVSHVRVNSLIDFYVDTASTYSIEEISSNEMQNRFQRITDEHIIYDYLDANIWLRVTIKNLQNIHYNSWYFESWGFDIKKITFYYPNPDGSFSPLSAGFAYPFFDRHINHKNFNYALNIRPQEERTYYLKINRNYNHQFSFHVRTDERFLSHSLYEYFLLGIYYGVLVLILIFNFYLFFKLRDKLYLYFLCLILACIWFSLGRDGLGFQFLWPNIPEINKFSNENIIELFIIVATLLFSNRFIQKYTKSNKVQNLTVWAISFKLLLFINQLFFIELYYITYIALTIFILLIPFSLGLYSLIKDKIYSWSYIFAYACLFLVIIYSYSKTIDLFENDILNWYIVYPVIFMEMIFFSFSIFNQIRYLKDEYIIATKEKNLALEKNNQLTHELNSKLKDKVKARTEKIEKMAADLAQKNVELQTTNLKLEELNAQVTQMNNFLYQNNEVLKSSVEEVNKNLALMKGLDFNDFKNVFPDKDACYKFLSELKWKNTYHCKKCAYNKYSDGPNYGRRCKNCNYYESPTVDTLFHKLKFPIEKAFYILYLSNRKDVDLTLNQLSEILELRRETCWAFKNKISLASDKVGHNKELSGWESLALVHLE